MSETITKSRIVDDLRDNLGIQPGDLIAVHSSMKSLGQVEGGPTTLIDALIEAVGGPGRGVVLMPCFTKPSDVVDIRKTPCRLGLVPEIFRTYPGVWLSHDRSHRVAVFGKDAKAIAECHRATTSLGPDSPFHELAKRGGSVVHIGCNFKSCSLIHVAEFLFPLPFHASQIAYPGYDVPVRIIDVDGTETVSHPKDGPGDSAAFLAVQNEMDRYGLIRHGKVGEAASLKARGLDILATAMALLSRDPAILLCQKPQCPVCSKKRQVLEEMGLLAR